MTFELRKSLLAVAAFAVLLSACGEKSKEDSVAAAKALMAKSQQAAAIVELKSALQKQPNAGEIRYLLGVALLRTGDFAGAILELGKAAELGYDDEQVMPKLAQARIGAGKYAEVVRSLEKVELRNRTSQADLLSSIALAHAVQGQEKLAQQAVEKALALEPDFPAALSVKARFLAAAGDYDGALAMLEKSLAAKDDRRGEALMLKGTVLRFGKRDSPAAEAVFQEAAKEPGQAIFARTALVQAFLGDGRMKLAEAQIAELKKSHPTSPVTAYLEAVLAYAARDFVRADGLAEQLLKLAPDNAQLLLLGGATSLQRGNLLAAESRFGKVIHVERHASAARKLLADTYLRMGQPEKALGTLRPLLERGQHDAAALSIAGQAYLATGRPVDAEGMFAAAAKLKPGDILVRTALAMTDLAKGNAAAAFDALQTIANQDSGDAADQVLISAHLKRQEFDAALKAIDHLATKMPTAPGPKHLRGVTLRAKGESDAARAAFEEALKLNPKHFVSTAALVSLDLQERKLDQAKSRIEAVIAQEPANTMARMLLLDVLFAQKASPAVMLSQVDEAIKASPDAPQPRVAKISMLMRRNDSSAAAAAAQDALAALPNEPAVLEEAGRALGVSGHEQQALSAFNKWANLVPNSPQPYIRLAELHARKGNTAAIASNLVRGLEVAPESAEVQRRMINFAMRSKDFNSVQQAARDLQQRSPGMSVGHLLEGQVAVAKGTWPVAIAAFRQAVQKVDPTGRSPALLYDALFASGDRAGADRFAAEWLAKHSGDVQFMEHLAGAALVRKDHATAERYYQKVLDVEPRNVAVINNLAWSMADRKAKGAAAMAQRAVDLAPRAAPVQDTLAWALAAEGQYDRAVEASRKAIEAMPTRPQYRLNLARILLQAGKKTDAQAELDAVLKSGDPVEKSEVEAVKAAIGR